MKVMKIDYIKSERDYKIFLKIEKIKIGLIKI